MPGVNIGLGISQNHAVKLAKTRPVLLLFQDNLVIIEIKWDLRNQMVTFIRVICDLAPSLGQKQPQLG
jgi:hypothetical protein